MGLFCSFLYPRTEQSQHKIGLNIYLSQIRGLMSCLFVRPEIAPRQGEAWLVWVPPTVPARLCGLMQSRVPEAALGEGWAGLGQLLPPLRTSPDCGNAAEDLAGSGQITVSGGLPKGKNSAKPQVRLAHTGWPRPELQLGPSSPGLPLGTVSASCFVGLCTSKGATLGASSTSLPIPSLPCAWGC